MKNLFTLICFTSCITLFTLSSCEKAMEPLEQEYQEPTAADFLRMNVIPAVMFSVNTYSVETEQMNTFLIDNKGKIRSSSIDTNRVPEFDFLLTDRLNLKRDKANLTDLYEVDLEALVESFKLLATVNGLSFDHKPITNSTNSITTIYGYYYVTQHDEFCIPTNSVSSTLYKSMLLAQSVDGKEIQSIRTGKSILDFLHRTVKAESE